MAARLPPYILWRSGRPRFHPSAREQQLGFFSYNLVDSQGAWLSYEQTCAVGWPLYAEILACRGYEAAQVETLVAAAKRGEELRIKPRGKKRKRNDGGVIEEVARGDTVEDLLIDWLSALEQQKDPSERLSDSAIVSYRKSARAIIYRPETREEATRRRDRERAAEMLGLSPPERAKEVFAQAPVAIIGKIELNNFFHYLKAERGHHMARAAIAAFSAAYTWGGLSTRWRLGPNPRHELTIPQPEGRIVIYSDAEIRQLDAAAALLKRWSIGDSILLGLFTAQRQGDRLTLRDEGLVDGRRQIRQSKTGKLVAVKETPQLTARLEQAKARVAALCLARGLRPEQRPETVIVDESTCRPYQQDTYRHWFSQVRRAAAEGISTDREGGEHNSGWKLEPMPSIAGKRDQDLRDTAVTWLARAGCTMSEICAITGHSGKSVQTIIEHYLGGQRELADAAIDKLTAWMQREGISL